MPANITGFARIEDRPSVLSPTSPRPSPGCSTSTPRAKPLASCGSVMLQYPDRQFVDVPGFLPGTKQEWRPHHPRRQIAVCLRRSNRPKITVITRKAYGGAYDVMSSKHSVPT